jgi:hypothetical protein
MSELGEVPADLDLICPSIRVLDEKEKAELAKAVADTLVVYQNAGVMSPRVVGREVKQSSDLTGVGTNLTNEDIAKLSDKVQAEGEMGEGLFGEGKGGLSAASGPAKALKEEDKAGKEKLASPSSEHLAEIPEDEDENEDEDEDTVAPVGTAPAMDSLPTGLKPGSKVDVNGKQLTVRKVTTGTHDLFGEPTVQVAFTTGEVVAYAAPERAEDEVPSVIYKDHEIKIVPVATPGSRRVFAAYKNGKRVTNCFATVKEVKTALSSQATDATIPRRGDKVRGPGAITCTVTSVIQPKGAVQPAFIEMKDRRGSVDRVSWSEFENGRYKIVSNEGWNGFATDADGPSTKHADMMLYHALPVRIETPKGGTRSGPGWTRTLPAAYGFIEGTTGADGDSIDCYVGPDPESSNVYVVDQYKLDGKSFDEHKVMLGYLTQEAAVADYMAGHHLSDRVFAAMTRFTMPQFRKWLSHHDMTQPCDPSVEVRPWA